VHNTLVWKTVAFEADPGGHVHFTVWNTALFGYLAMLLFFGLAPLGLGLASGIPKEEGHAIALVSRLGRDAAR
jgi:hypothetical protein